MPDPEFDQEAPSAQSPGALAERLRADILQARTAFSRARLQHGEGSPLRRAAEEQWSPRQAIVDTVAEQRGVRPEEVELTRVSAHQLISAARAVRSKVTAATPAADFLAATAFLDAPPAPAGGLPEWSPEPPSRFVRVDPAELDDEQRRWLPDPIPANVRVLRCTACGQMRAEIPERGVDPWKDHDDECTGEPDEDDDDQ